MFNHRKPPSAPRFITPDYKTMSQPHVALITEAKSLSYPKLCLRLESLPILPPSEIIKLERPRGETIFHAILQNPTLTPVQIKNLLFYLFDQHNYHQSTNQFFTDPTLLELIAKRGYAEILAKLYMLNLEEFDYSNIPKKVEKFVWRYYMNNRDITTLKNILDKIHNKLDNPYRSFRFRIFVLEYANTSADVMDFYNALSSITLRKTNYQSDERYYFLKTAKQMLLKIIAENSKSLNTLPVTNLAFLDRRFSFFLCFSCFFKTKSRQIYENIVKKKKNVLAEIKKQDKRIGAFINKIGRN